MEGKLTDSNGRDSLSRFIYWEPNLNMVLTPARLFNGKPVARRVGVIIYGN